MSTEKLINGCPVVDRMAMFKEFLKYTAIFTPIWSVFFLSAVIIYHWKSGLLFFNISRPVRQTVTVNEEDVKTAEEGDAVPLPPPTRTKTELPDMLRTAKELGKNVASLYPAPSKKRSKHDEKDGKKTNKDKTKTEHKESKKKKAVSTVSPNEQYTPDKTQSHSDEVKTPPLEEDTQADSYRERHQKKRHTNFVTEPTQRELPKPKKPSSHRQRAERDYFGAPIPKKPASNRHRNDHGHFESSKPKKPVAIRHRHWQSQTITDPTQRDEYELPAKDQKKENPKQKGQMKYVGTPLEKQHPKNVGTPVDRQHPKNVGTPVDRQNKDKQSNG